MGNQCETYCSYEEQAQLNFYGKGEFMTEKSKVQYTTKKSNKSMAQMKSMKSPDEKSTYFLRGMGPTHNSSPVRSNIKPVSRVESPERQEIIVEEPVIIPPKPKRIRKVRGDKFPFEYIPYCETEYRYGDDYIYSQKLQVTNNISARSSNFSPRRERSIKEEEKLAFYLNNIAISERCIRPPSLANEIIMTHTEIRKEAPEKRLKTRDAGIQSVEKISRRSTDVSTITDNTPLQTRAIQEPPPVIEEVVKKPKNKIAKKKVVEEQVHEVIIDPDEEILLEGEMSKFKPGIEKNFIQRWIQLSTRSFRYYKNHYHSICYLTRPISALPLYVIESVQNFSIGNVEYKRKEKEQYSFMFEIVLKQDYEDIFFFREFEVNGLNNSNSASPVRISVSPGRQSVREGSNDRNSLGRKSRSPTKSLVHHNSVNGQITITNQLEVNGKVVPTSRMVYVSPNRLSESPSQSVMIGGGVHSKVTRIVQGHLMTVRDQNKGHQREHYLEDQKIIRKEFGDPQVNVHGDKQMYTWSNRQKEWYNSERRFIFSCKSDQERKKWMAAIRLAVVENNERLRGEYEELSLMQQPLTDQQKQLKYVIQSQKISSTSKFDSPSKSSPIKTHQQHFQKDKYVKDERPKLFRDAST